MPIDLIQSVSWPGVLGVESCQYICSHGISPGRWVLVTYPQAAAPEEFGDLVFTDGLRSVTIPNCKVDRITPQMTSDGTTYTIEGVDERWQWIGLGGISGRYNQKDDRGKLVPWTIRSPAELAALCLAALGITNVEVNLPLGLSQSAGENVDRYLRAGENFPQSFTNPETVWDHTPPALALAQLADYYGCRVVYQPLTRSVYVGPVGVGDPLPDLPAEVIGATIDGPEAPAFVGVFGAPITFQHRFLLQAVGEEWDGTYVPINQLSYAPVVAQKQVQKSQIRFLGTDTINPIEVTVSFTDPKTGQVVSFEAKDTGPGETMADRLNAIQSQLAGFPQLTANISVTYDGASAKLFLTGLTPFNFSVTAINPASFEQSFIAERLQPAKNANVASWATSNPPYFSNVQATDRLSYAEARALAQKSVFRCYRIMLRDPSDFSPIDQLGKPLVFPVVGKIFRRQQLLLRDTKYDIVLPRPRIPGAVNKSNPLAVSSTQGVFPDFYNGYSRQQGATVTGSIYLRLAGDPVNWLFGNNSIFNKLPSGTEGAPSNNAGPFNTAPTSRVFVPFSVNAKEQMVEFSSQVYALAKDAGAFGQVAEPVLTLETGCYVLDVNTNQVIRFEQTLAVPGGVAPIEWQHREDVEVGVISRFTEDGKNTFTAFEVADQVDAVQRASYYLEGQAAKYQIKGGETRHYIGIIPQQPDGYTQQVAWIVGGEGATTIVSANTEFHVAIPPYPERRRRENLPPNKAAADANRQEYELTRTLFNLIGIPLLQ